MRRRGDDRGQHCQGLPPPCPRRDGAPPLPSPAASQATNKLTAATVAAEERVAVLVAEKTAVENEAQEVAQKGISTRDALKLAQAQEGKLKQQLIDAKAEESTTLQTYIALEATAAEFRARIEAGGSMAALIPADLVEPLKSEGAAEGAAGGEKGSAAAEAEEKEEKEKAAAEAAGAAQKKKVEKALAHPGAIMGSSRVDKWNVFGAPIAFYAAAKRRFGFSSVVVAIALAVALVVPLPFVRRAWNGGLPPVSALVHKAAVESGRLLTKGKKLIGAKVQELKSAKAPQQAAGEHGAADPHGGDSHAHDESGLMDVLFLLGTSVLAVPLISKLPGGSPVLGFLFGGALIGPNALGLIAHVDAVKHIAEIGVVFLLFNIGLELSLERLQSMAKFVFGLGSAQVVATTAAVAAVAMGVGGVSLPAGIVIGVGLAFSSTAVALQVLGDRGEASSRHGRGAFSVLLLQDLAVVLVFMLVPLLGNGGGPDGQIQGLKILVALGQAIVKTGAAIGVIIALGRIIIRPIYRFIAMNGNTDIFSATTLLVALGTSHLTGVLGLSAALGAFLAGLLLAETEYHLQVESDIAPYRGLLLGLFFMTVGMTIDPQLLVSRFVPIFACIFLLIAGKTLLVTALGRAFGLQSVTAARAGMYLAPAGEFAFVTNGLAVTSGLISASLNNELTLVVALSMAFTPALADAGARLREWYDKKYPGDIKALLPEKEQVDDLKGHVIICGFGRSGQLIAQLLSELLIPFVVLDMQSDRVQQGRGEEIPIFFGDAGSPAVLHSVGAERASCAVVTLDQPSANYRTVWAFNKHYPNVSVYVRAADTADGLRMEQAGATGAQSSRAYPPRLGNPAPAFLPRHAPP